jgi:hypothetical protein
MNVVCYLDDHHESGNRLAALVQSFVPKAQVTICRTREELTHRLLQPTQDVRAAVLLACDHQHLGLLLSLRDMLSDCRTILVLPDRAPSTVAQGHTLRPRLLTYMDTDFVPLVGAVLDRIQSGCFPQANGETAGVA